jgi:ABC-type phosphate transport system auxiliary subunit
MTDTKKLREAAERESSPIVTMKRETILTLLDELDALRAENNRLAFERDLARRDKARAETERNEMEQRLSDAKV